MCKKRRLSRSLKVEILNFHLSHSPHTMDFQKSYKRTVGIYELEYESSGTGAGGSIEEIFYSLQNKMNPIHSLIKYFDTVTEFLPFLLKLVEKSDNFNSLLLWTVARFLSAFSPSIELYYTSQLFRLAEEALERRTINKFDFFAILIKFFSISIISMTISWIWKSREAEVRFMRPGSLM